MRTFVDCGKAIQGLLQLAINQGTSVDYATRLLAAFPSDATEPTRVEQPSPIQPLPLATPDSQIEPLNEREAAILKFMAAGLPNREIASELFLSVNTVRWHAHNLFGKLGVSRRSEAVARARELGLL